MSKDQKDLETKVAELGKELSDDEVSVAVGGDENATCVCVVGGGGKADDNDNICVCVLAGTGVEKEAPCYANGTGYADERCMCIIGGGGKDT